MLIESEEGATEAPMAQMSTQPSLVSRKWVGTRSVFPAKAGIQATGTKNRARARKAIVSRQCQRYSAM